MRPDQAAPASFDYWLGAALGVAGPTSNLTLTLNPNPNQATPASFDYGTALEQVRGSRG